ncbi:MAG: GNAT family N-acetyltransferase [Saprospiraceae bacterium]|nr:GNAT family N-acetyltransferase [Saprospiraceae bacterium]
MTVQSLSGTPVSAITEAFNSAFSDYFFPVHLTPDQIQAKLRSENVDLHYSMGAFEAGALVGFVLHGTTGSGGQKIAYNAGTGVVPSHRGQKITTALYDYMLPSLKQDGFRTIRLEVITRNAPAIKIYQAIGFETKRVLGCYKGSIDSKNAGPGYRVQTLEHYAWPEWRSFWDWQPSWQNAVPTLEQLSATTVVLGCFKGDTLVGYLVLNPKTFRVHQFAVRPEMRRQQVAQTLFAHVAEHFSKEVSMINIDENDAGTLRFLKHIGLEQYLTQYEMEYHLP